MNRFLPTVLVATLAACASFGPQDGVTTLITSPLDLEPPPIYALLGYRAELELTSAQVDALDSIARYVQREHRPLAQEVRDGSRDRPRQPGILDVNAETADAFEEIRELQAEAASSVREVLTEKQRETVCQLFDGAPSGRAGPQLGARQDASGASSGEGNIHAVATANGGPVWPWCDGPTAPRASEPR